MNNTNSTVITRPQGPSPVPCYSTEIAEIAIPEDHAA